MYTISRSDQPDAEQPTAFDIDDVQTWLATALTELDLDDDEQELGPLALQQVLDGDGMVEVAGVVFTWELQLPPS